MPKKVTKEIHVICRVFLWTGTDANSRKALYISWEHMCLPKICGGWNLKDLIIWNKAAVLKHCWALSQKQDTPWVKWIHTYYIKARDFWTMDIPNGLTWSMRNIWSSRNVLLDAGNPPQFTHEGKFRIQRIYKHMRQEGSQVTWKRLICNSKASP